MGFIQALCPTSAKTNKVTGRHSVESSPRA